MICMHPMAPLEDTTRGLPPDSAIITRSTTSTGKPERLAASGA
ncbi:hypothetical protein MGWOODY_Smn2965 [hydrothermal vent metagenome]|uniref:Uncharacterized protein n=1 Tax=hydrothermal vent metagenome TaxID=652676 RepID=A0A160TIZ7_9ZZZZ